MDALIPHFVNLVDKSADIVSPLLNEAQVEQLDKLCGWLKQNDSTVIYSTLGALVFTTLYLISGTSSDSKKSPKSKRTPKIKIKKVKTIPVDPIKQGLQIIKTVKAELDEKYIALVETLEKDVAAENAGVETKEPVSYKDSTQYRKLFLNETLLALLLKLDEVTADLRTERKAAVKEIQTLLKRVDAIKV